MTDDEKIIHTRSNWGQIKGGLNSSGTIKKIIRPDYSKELAEFTGIILGDGNIQSYTRSKKVGVYSVRIAGHLKLDYLYLIHYVKPLGEKLFGLKAGIYKIIKQNELFICFYSKELVNFLSDIGLCSGDKIISKIGIPQWIRNDETYIKACLRGLIDTDGSIFRMSKRDKNLIRIGFTNHNSRLLEDVHDAFIGLGYCPSKIMKNRAFVISRQDCVRKYINEIGFSNEKHRSRLRTFFIAP